MDAVDSGLLILRVCLGLTMVAHGYGKLFRGGRIPGTAGWFESIGMRPGSVNAWLAAVTEVAAGIALALGLFTPAAAAAFVSLMFVAAWTVHRGKGFFIVSDGWEYNLVLAVGAVVVAITGPGAASLDHLMFGHDLVTGWAGGLVAAVGGLAAAGALLAVAYRPAPENVPADVA
ncbi:DoxX family protein [Rhodococcus sp. SC4]|uniref:DoxX family protein n=1 Tax=unclassified Rhodococcus (in: high G+C Gram-positive bacteria) TaxID=192944 RepID=UPI000769C36E|nr:MULTISPECIES: DoxX family protein [unclassified Rhodococcus (in: high G+C Gram-positive bacteria)]KXF49271.1 DoxX family protein [Rhodococcus sp. SC4]KXX63126.1 DoxX family protein [Rhodococcus sp. LB1]PBC56384.1 DoxX family protein [Rhodococcus sp. ACPA1]